MCRDKWKNLRNSYGRYLRDLKKPSGAAASKKKIWYLADSMGFLKDYMGIHRASSSNVDVQETSPSEIHVSDVDEPDEETSEERALAPPLRSSSAGSCNRSCKRKSESAATLLAGPVAEYLRSKVQMNDGTKDPMLLFFEGILPEVAQLNAKRKRYFKGKVIDLVNQLLDDQEAEVACQSISHVTSPINTHSHTSSQNGNSRDDLPPTCLIFDQQQHICNPGVIAQALSSLQDPQRAYD